MTENYLKSPDASDKEVQVGLQTYAQSKGLAQAYVDNTFSEYKNKRSGNDVNAFYLAYKTDNTKLAELTTPEAVLKQHPNLTQEQAVYWSGRAVSQIDQNQKAYERQQKEVESDAKDASTEMRNDIETGLNRYAGRRDVDSMRQVDGLNSLKDLVALKQEQISKQFEIKKAVEQSKLKAKTDNKIDASVSSHARQNYASGENLGKRIGNAERRITELRAKMHGADSVANKAIAQKFKELDKRVNELNTEFDSYLSKAGERQEKRSQVAERLNTSITPRQQELLADARYKAAMKYQTHIFNEESVAIIEAGVRERSIINLGDSRFTNKSLRIPILREDIFCHTTVGVNLF